MGKLLILLENKDNKGFFKKWEFSEPCYKLQQEVVS